MNLKLIFKISVLLFAFTIVIFAMKYFASPPFKQGLENAFNTGASFEWCSAKKQKIKWLDERIAKKMGQLAHQVPEIRLNEKYCSVQMESLRGQDLKAVSWQKLAQGIDSGGQIVFLEWDPALHIYRAAGLPFKSSVLDRDFSE